MLNETNSVKLLLWSVAEHLIKTTNVLSRREVTKKLGRWCKAEGLMSRIDVNEEIYKTEGAAHYSMCQPLSY